MERGVTWASNFRQISTEHMILYSTVIIVSLIIQIFLLVTTMRIVLKIKKTSTRGAMVIPYVYVTSQVFVIALLAYLLVEQLATSSYQSVLSKLTED